jgi:hypothetical protein
VSTSARFGWRRGISDFGLRTEFTAFLGLKEDLKSTI